MAKEWTEQDIREFADLVRKQGGKLRLPVKATRDGGVDAEIEQPATAPDDWGQQLLNEFDRKRK